MKTLISLTLFVVSAGAFSATALAAPSIIEGNIAKIVEKKREIYVQSKADGKKHEYYFNDQTQISKGGKPAQFSDLKVDQHVKVTAEKKGKRLDPQQVEILE